MATPSSGVPTLFRGEHAGTNRWRRSRGLSTGIVHGVDENLVQRERADLARPIIARKHAAARCSLRPPARTTRTSSPRVCCCSAIVLGASARRQEAGGVAHYFLAHTRGRSGANPRCRRRDLRRRSHCCLMRDHVSSRRCRGLVQAPARRLFCIQREECRACRGRWHRCFCCRCSVFHLFSVFAIIFCCICHARRCRVGQQCVLSPWRTAELLRHPEPQPESHQRLFHHRPSHLRTECTNVLERGHLAPQRLFVSMTSACLSEGSMLSRLGIAVVPHGGELSDRIGCSVRLLLRC